MSGALTGERTVEQRRGRARITSFVGPELVEFADRGARVVLIDLDVWCHLSLLRLEQLQVGRVNEYPPAASPGHLSKDPCLLEARERGVHRRGAQPEQR
jgi:hypothetical protein